jgi:hypothetical protein
MQSDRMTGLLYEPLRASARFRSRRRAPMSGLSLSQTEVGTAAACRAHHRVRRSADQPLWPPIIPCIFVSWEM